MLGRTGSSTAVLCVDAAKGWAYGNQRLQLLFRCLVPLGGLFRQRKTADFVGNQPFVKSASGGTWTRTSIRSLPPEDSASTIPPRSQTKNYPTLHRRLVQFGVLRWSARC